MLTEIFLGIFICSPLVLLLYAVRRRRLAIVKDIYMRKELSVGDFYNEYYKNIIEMSDFLEIYEYLESDVFINFRLEKLLPGDSLVDFCKDNVFLSPFNEDCMNVCRIFDRAKNEGIDSNPLTLNDLIMIIYKINYHN